MAIETCVAWLEAQASPVIHSVFFCTHGTLAGEIYPMVLGNVAANLGIGSPPVAEELPAEVARTESMQLADELEIDRADARRIIDDNSRWRNQAQR